MSEDNKETSSQEVVYTQKQVFTILSKAGLGSSLGEILEEAKNNPDNFKTEDQLGNALRPILNKQFKSKFDEGVRKSAAKNEKLLKEQFPDVDFGNAKVQEDYIKNIQEHYSLSKGKNEEPLTRGQIEDLPRVKQLKSEVEELKKGQNTLTERLKTEQHQQELLHMGLGVFSTLNPDFSKNPQTRKIQEDSLRTSIRNIRVKRTEDGSIALDSNGNPIPIDEAGAPLVNSDNSTVTFTDLLKQRSPVDFNIESVNGNSPTDRYKNDGNTIVFNPDDQDYDKRTQELIDKGDHKGASERIAAKEKYITNNL